MSRTNADLIRQQVELETANPGSPRVLPQLHGLTGLIRGGLVKVEADESENDDYKDTYDYGKEEDYEDEDGYDDYEEEDDEAGEPGWCSQERYRGEGYVLADFDVLHSALMMAGVDTVIIEAFGTMEEFTTEDLDAPAADRADDLDTWEPVERDETLREWMLRSFGQTEPTGKSFDSSHQYKVTIPGYGQVILHAEAHAFYEEAWFIAVTTPEGIIVGWDASGGVDWS